MLQNSCKNCQKNFEITEEDFKFYKQVDVPPATHCPPCREQRRMAWCNEGTLYPHKCEKCKKSVISQLAPHNPRPVYCVECWWSDKFDATKYAKDIDFNRSMFEQIHELEISIPHLCVAIDTGAINSEYTHHAGQEKNCYFLFHATFAEDCYYGYGVKKAKNCVDVHYCHDCELCYECIDITNCYNLGWCQDCFNCSDSRFLRDCIGCKNCFLCTGLRNKSYCFMNQQLTKEKYEEAVSKFTQTSHEHFLKGWKAYQEIRKKHHYKNLSTNMTQDSTGDHLYRAKNAHFCFDCSDIEDSKYCTQMQLGVKNCYDIYQYGVNAELCYESAMTGTTSYNNHFCYLCLWQVSDLKYCLDSYNSKNCFGCFGLKNNRYCILNKQYSEKEYYELLSKIIEKMKAEKEYGEFFPIKYAHSAYNESMANYCYPMSKEEVLAKGWKWEDKLPGTYHKETIKNLPDDLSEISDEIVNEILACEKCHKNYKIIEQELKFYRKYHYPLPRKCFECRRFERMALRNPRQLWDRQCSKCQEPLQTTYSPDRPEIIYCEKCYLSAIC